MIPAEVQTCRRGTVSVCYLLSLCPSHSAETSLWPLRLVLTHPQVLCGCCLRSATIRPDSELKGGGTTTSWNKVISMTTHL